MTAQPVIDFEKVTKTFGAPPTTALHEVSVKIMKGELVGIVGPSGSGKSTMLNLMGTLDRPTAGRVLIDGNDVGALRDRDLAGLRAHRIGFVFQQFHLAHGVDALDNVATGLLYTGVKRSERRERAEVALRKVGLGHRLGHQVNQMSGGEKQRVAIARAVVGEPAVVLADEPTGALDSRSGSAVLDLLQSLNEAGTTVVVITHDLALAAQLPRRISLRDGQVVADETEATPSRERILTSVHGDGEATS